MIESIICNKVNFRILRILHEHPNSFLTANEISKYGNVSGGALWSALNKLSAFNIILKEGSIKKPKYKINAYTYLFYSLEDLLRLENSKFQFMEIKVKNSISEFINSLFLKYTDVSKIYLFGSQAKGTASPDSDIDILILKENINSKIELDIQKIKNKINPKISVLIHTNKEFDISKEPLFKEIKKDGILLNDIFLKKGNKPEFIKY